MSLEALPDKLKLLAEEAFAFRQTLSPESDRGCALMGAAFLDSRLKMLIERRLIDEPKVVERFLDFNGPAGAFSSRIDFCYLTGMLPKTVQSDLHLIRKIRNEFGHRVEPITFETPEISSRCELLQNNGVPKDARARHKFTNTCFGVLSAIDLAIIEPAAFKSPQDIVQTPEQKTQFHQRVLQTFNATLDEISSEELGSPEAKAKIFARVIAAQFKPDSAHQ